MDRKTKTNNEYNLSNFLINKERTILSNNKVFEKQITYPSDIDDNGVYKGMTDNNMIEYPIEVREYVDNKLVKGELNTFKEFNNKYLPYEKYQVETNTPLTSFNIFDGNKDSKYPTLPKLKYNVYGSNGRINEIVQNDGTSIVYLWGYYNEYPIAEIKNSTLNDVINNLGISIDNLSSSITPDMTKVDGLRAKLPNALINTYIYKPLVGIVTAKDSRGVVTTYNYDDFNRLMNIKDLNGKTLKSFDYHYKQ